MPGAYWSASGLADRIPAPADLGDLSQTILPSRACLLSVRDVLAPARQAALDDALAAARKAARRDDHDQQAAAALACCWEAVSALELASTVAAPWVDPQTSTTSGAWVEMTI